MRNTPNTLDPKNRNLVFGSPKFKFKLDHYFKKDTPSMSGPPLGRQAAASSHTVTEDPLQSQSWPGIDFSLSALAALCCSEPSPSKESDPTALPAPEDSAPDVPLNAAPSKKRRLSPSPPKPRLDARAFQRRVVEIPTVDGQPRLAAVRRID